MIICKLAKEDKRKIFLVANFLQLSLLLGLRSENVGVDTKSYLHWMMYIERGYRGIFEIGDLYLIKAILAVFGDYQAVFLVYAGLTVGITLYAIYHLSDDPYLSTLLYTSTLFYSAAFNIMRQCLALAIVLLAYKELKYEKRIKALLLALLASCFHISAFFVMIVICIFAISNHFIIKNDRIHRFLMIIVPSVFGVLCYVYSMNILGLIAYATKYGHYIYNALRGSSYGGHTSFWNPIFFLCLFVFSAYILRDKGEEFERKSVKIFMVGVFIYIMAIRFGLLHRIAMYFVCCMIWLLPNLKKYFMRRDWRILYQFTLVGISVTYNLLMIFMNFNGIVPYSFYWE